MKIRKYSSLSSFQQELLHKISYFIEGELDEIIRLVSELFNKKGFLVWVENNEETKKRYLFLFACVSSESSSSLVVTLLRSIVSEKLPREEELRDTIMFLEKEASNQNMDRIDFLVSSEHEFFIEMLHKQGYSRSKTLFEKTLPFSHNLRDVLELFTQEIRGLGISDYNAEIGLKDSNGVLHLFPISSFSKEVIEIDNYRAILLVVTFYDERVADDFFKHTNDLIKWDTTKMLFSKNLSYSFTSMT